MLPCRRCRSCERRRALHKKSTAAAAELSSPVAQAVPDARQPPGRAKQDRNKLMKGFIGSALAALPMSRMCISPSHPMGMRHSSPVCSPISTIPVISMTTILIGIQMVSKQPSLQPLRCPWRKSSARPV
jgi:hypothetical protein